MGVRTTVRCASVVVREPAVARQNRRRAVRVREREDHRKRVRVRRRVVVQRRVTLQKIKQKKPRVSADTTQTVFGESLPAPCRGRRRRRWPTCRGPSLGCPDLPGSRFHRRKTRFVVRMCTGTYGESVSRHTTGERLEVRTPLHHL